MHELTEKDKKTLDFIIQYQYSNGYTPSMEEMKKALNTKSTRGVALHLEKLTKNKYISRDPNARRAIKVLIKPEFNSEEIIKVPVVGEVKAGYGGITEASIEEYREIPISKTRGRRDVLLLRIRGESMLKAGYENGDLALIIPQSFASNDDIVVAYDPEDGTTIKRLKKLKDYLVLLPESNDPTYKPKIGTHFQIQGKVIGKL